MKTQLTKEQKDIILLGSNLRENLKYLLIKTKKTDESGVRLIIDTMLAGKRDKTEKYISLYNEVMRYFGIEGDYNESKTN